MVGDGVLENGNKLRITVQASDGSGNNVFNITGTKSMQELVDKINTVTGGVLRADLDSRGFLAISNNTGSSIVVDAVDSTGAVTAAASALVERATGFDVHDGTLVGTAQAISDSAEGQIILTSVHGDPISVSIGATGTVETLQNLGFRETGDVGTVKGVGLTSAAAATRWNVGDLTINGVQIDNSDTESMQGKVNAVNRHSADTGVVANAYASVALDLSNADLTALSANTDSLVINGVLVDLGLVSGDTSTQLVDAFNRNTDRTGVTAYLSGTRIMLESDQGSIQIAASSANSILSSGGALSGAVFTSYVSDSTGALTTSAWAATSASSLTVEAGLKLSSTNGQPISIELGINANPGTLGLMEANSTAQGRFGTAIASVSIDTAANAQKAIGVIDNALDTINNIRADLGATNNRLDFTINNLMSVTENTAAARSRIMDADFAAETAALSRAQVLQQASQAMLAQANAQSQQVLQLLQG
ncbi:MAG: flagellin [Cellvibrionaceae bacterium]|nr:flagellin [Cellvibrionaceae bacterium]